MSIRFWFRKTTLPHIVNLLDDAPGQIQMRITYNAEREELGSTHITCTKAQWDAANQTFRGKSVWATEQNRKLFRLQKQVEAIIETLERDTDDVTATLIKDTFCRKPTERKRQSVTLVDVFSQHYQYQQQRFKQGKIEKSTLEVQDNYANNVIDFLKDSRREKLSASHLTEQFLDDLAHYLIATAGFGNAHTEKHLKFVKQAMKFGVSRKLIANNPISHYQVEKQDEEPDTTHLTIEQLQRLIDYDFFSLVRKGVVTEVTAHTLAQERDAFVFNCFTGMHHCDYTGKQFRIEQDQDGYWLTGSRKKTQKPFFLKLLEPGVEIYKRYGGLEGLPVKSNQKRNDSLKFIAVYVGLPMRLSTKIARKTFADLALNEMLIPAEDVATMLGLASTQRLKHYVRPRRSRIAKLLLMWDSLTNQTPCQTED